MATNMNVLKSAAGQGGSYQQFLQRIAAGGGFEGKEASALINSGMYSTDGQQLNSIANSAYNGNALDSSASGIALALLGGGGYDANGQITGTGGGKTSYYGPQGLANLNNVYQQAWQSSQNGAQSRGGGGSGGGSSYDRNQAALYDQGISTLNNNLGRLDTQKSNALANISSQYSTNLNELQGVFDKAKQGYGSQTTQNSQSLRTNNNNIDDKASAGLRSLTRLLGSYGAGGSSDMYNASDAVAKTATAERSGANQTFAENQRNLDTNWANFQSDDKNSRKKLNDWRDNQRNSIEAETLSNRQSLLNQIAQAQAAKASYMGGNAAAAGQSYIDQANSLSGRIDSLGRNVSSYDGKTPTYTQTSLDSYATPTDTKIQTGTIPGVNNSTLFNTLYNKKDEDDNRFF